MSFYTDKWIIGNIDKDNIILIKRKKNNLILERLTKESDYNSKDIIAKDIYKEYDIALDLPNNIYLLYQDLDMNLILKRLNIDKVDEVKLTPSAIGEVIDLNIKVRNKNIHIIYITKKFRDTPNYIINHHYYNGKFWNDFIVDEINAEEVLNPIKVIQEDNDIFISYYNNKELKLKEFSSSEEVWSSEIVLVNSQSKKLFLDMIFVEETLHIVYCHYISSALVVKYEAFQNNDGQYVKLKEEILSNEGSPSYPNLIFYNSKLWITWVELNKIFSRYSIDEGSNWGPIYLWDERNFLRYKYLSLVQDRNIILDYSFGSISPEIRFIGFGPTNKAKEVPLKKRPP